jgi:hypothetical protein
VTITDAFLDGLKKADWFALRMKDEDARKPSSAQKQIQAHEKEFELASKTSAEAHRGDELLRAC